MFKLTSYAGENWLRYGGGKRENNVTGREESVIAKEEKFGLKVHDLKCIFPEFSLSILMDN